MLWTKERPWRAAAAPTTSPNAMMPGVTASPRRIPSLKPDHTDFAGNGSEAVMGEYLRRPGRALAGPHTPQSIDKIRRVPGGIYRRAALRADPVAGTTMGGFDWNQPCGCGATSPDGDSGR